jgi:hypothetical protein
MIIRNGIINFKLNELVVIVFFILMVVNYGRGVSFSADSAENDVTFSYEKSSKAPFLIGCTIILLLLVKQKNKFDFSHVINYRFWYLFFAFLFILAMLKEDYWGELRNFLMIFFSYLLLFTLLKFVYTIPYKKLERLFINISFIICLLAVLFHYLQGSRLVFFPERTFENYDRLGGLFYYANTAAIISITFLFSIKIFFETKQKYYLFLCIVTGVLLIATDTRSAWFVTFASLIFILFKNIKFSILFILSALSYFVIAFNFLFSFSNKTIVLAGNDSAFRVEIWIYSLSIGLKKFFEGYGKVNPFENGYNMPASNLNDPHNSILSLFLQSGFIVCILYFLIYYLNYKKSTKEYDTSYRFLFFFWIFFPFFWGNIYNHLSNFISMYMMFTIYAFALNPEIKDIAENKVEEVQEQNVI